MDDDSGTRKKSKGQPARSRVVKGDSPSPLGGSRALSLSPKDYSTFSLIRFIPLTTFASVPRFDARGHDIDVKSARPYSHLPVLQGELEKGDVVWIGFHSNYYTRTHPDFLNTDLAVMNMKWVILLARGGNEAYEAVYQSESEGSVEE